MTDTGSCILYPVPFFSLSILSTFYQADFFTYCEKSVMLSSETERKQVFDKKEETCKDDIQLIGGRIYNIF